MCVCVGGGGGGRGDEDEDIWRRAFWNATILSDIVILSVLYKNINYIKWKYVLPPAQIYVSNVFEKCIIFPLSAVEVVMPFEISITAYNQSIHCRSISCDYMWIYVCLRYPNPEKYTTLCAWLCCITYHGAAWRTVPMDKLRRIKVHSMLLENELSVSLSASVK